MSTSKQAHIEALLESLSRDELLALIKSVARRIRQGEEHAPQPLYGIWKGKFSEDADIDTALKEIRRHWMEDLGEFDK